MREIKRIIRGCITGNRRDQELLYRRYSSKLYTVCLQYSSNADDARDVLQDGFIKIFTNLKQYSGEGSFEGWMRRIIVNTALEKYRSKHFLFRVDDIDEIKEPEFIVDNDDYSGMQANDLLNLIMRLPEKYRMVFNLYAIEGFNHREIGELLRISEGTSKSNLSRARGILKRELELIKTADIRYMNGQK